MQHGHVEPASVGLRAEQTGETIVYSHLRVARSPTSKVDTSSA